MKRFKNKSPGVTTLLRERGILRIIASMTSMHQLVFLLQTCTEMYTAMDDKVTKLAAFDAIDGLAHRGDRGRTKPICRFFIAHCVCTEYDRLGDFGSYRDFYSGGGKAHLEQVIREKDWAKSSEWGVGWRSGRPPDMWWTYRDSTFSTLEEIIELKESQDRLIQLLFKEWPL